MTSRGTVRVGHADEGWGVLDSADTPGGCWTHFSAVLVAGHRALVDGAAVEFTFERAEQGGYSYRAVEVWPAGQAPVRGEVSEDSAAYRSTLTLSLEGDA
jgi:cold shock protein